MPLLVSDRAPRWQFFAARLQIVQLDKRSTTRVRARVPTPVKNTTMSKPFSESLRANEMACVLEASGISRIEGATGALPPLLSISFPTSGARRLPSDSTRKPAKPPLEVSFPTIATIAMMQQSGDFFHPWMLTDFHRDSCRREAE